MTPSDELIDRLIAFARRSPRAPAVLDTRVSLSYRDLADQAGALAARLAREGIDPGGRVGYLGASRAEAVVTLVACWSLGATVALVDPAAGASAVAASLKAYPLDLLVQPNGAAPAAGLRTLVMTAFPEQALESSLSPLEAARVKAESIGAVVFTSGSTGLPKGVLVSHRALAASAVAVSAYLELRPSDGGALLVPVGTRMGLSSTLAHLWSGSALLLEAGLLGGGTGFESRHALAATTSITCVPTQLRVLLDRGLLARSVLPRVRTLRIGAGSLSVRDVDRARATCPGAEVLLTYGTSETGEISVARSDDLLLPGCVGRPLPDVALSLLDSSGRLAPEGRRGEIAAASPRVMTRYHDAPDELRTAHRTGDLGRVVGGRLFLEGREREMVKSGGESISPLAVERVLREHPDVADAVVIGISDELLGEAPLALVVPQPGTTRLDAGALRAACAATLSRLSVPRKILLVDAIPRLPSGKPDRPALLVMAGLAGGPR